MYVCQKACFHSHLQGLPNMIPTLAAALLSEEWRKFKDHAKLMFQGPLKRAGTEEQSAYILIWAGETGREICNSWGLTDDQKKKKDVTILFERFEAHATPKKNTVFARYVFHERK